MAKERGERELVGVPDDDTVDDGSQPRRAAIPVTRLAMHDRDPALRESPHVIDADAGGERVDERHVHRRRRVGREREALPAKLRHESAQERVGTAVGAAPRDGVEENAHQRRA